MDKIRSVEGDDHRIEGVAIVYNKPSQDMGFIEYVSPHALEGVDLSQLLLLYSHDYQNVLASIQSGTLKVDNQPDGLHFVAELPNTSLGNDVAELVSTKRVGGMSFGFQIADGGDQWKQQGNTAVHIVNQISSMSEISITPIPAYQETQVSTQVQRSLENFLKRSDNSMAQDEEKPAFDSEALINKLVDVLGGALGANKSDEQAPAEPEEDRAAKKAANPGVTVTQPGGTAKKKKGANANPGVTVTPQPGQKKRDDEDVVPDDGSEVIDTGDGGDDVVPDDSGAEELPVDDNEENAAKKPQQGSQQQQGKEQQAVQATTTTTQAPQQQKRSDTNMAKDITPENKVNEEKRSFEEYLKKGQVTRAVGDGGIVLEDGSVLIPEDILNPEHEKYQFPRLGSLVRNVSVKHTTGKLPVFYPGDGVLTEHAEYAQSDRHAIPEIKPINWDLATYTGSYVYSQDLLSDSDYNWESELQQRLIELRDNTNDAQIINALTKDIEKVAYEDKLADDGKLIESGLVHEIKQALDVKLQPQDSQQASIVVSQSAFAALDDLNDGFGRPLIQPDLTKDAGQRLLGKQLIVVPDELFPDAKVGDVNIVVAPLQKAVINFKNNEITGKFMDSYDIWYRILGIYMRQDVVQARPDLIVYIGDTSEATTTSTTSK